MQEDQSGSEHQQPGYAGPWSPVDSPSAQPPAEPASAAQSDTGPAASPDAAGPAVNPAAVSPAAVSPAAAEQGPPDQIAGQTIPLSMPGAASGPPQPGGGPSGPPQPGGGYGQPPAGGHAQAGDYGQAQPGGGYGAPPGGGYGQPPPGGYAQAGGYGPGPYGGAGGGYGPGRPGGPYGAGGLPGDYIQPPPPPPRSRGRGLVTYIAIAALAAGVGAGTVLALKDTGSSQAQQSGQGNNSGLGGGLGLGNGSGAGSGSGLGNGSSGNAAGTGLSSAKQQAVENAVQPGLVDITSSLRYENGTAAATGMVISSSGIVLTNNHVIDASTALTGRVVDTGQRYVARVLGYDRSNDVAVIQLIGASGLKTVPLGNSDSVKLGNGVVAIGNADGTGGATVVTGSITGLNQTITASDQGSSTGSETLHGMLQTNADIIPGDSGGPLADASGQVIGMNTAAASGSFGDAQPNVGFAIPIDRAMAIARQIIAGHGSSSIQIGLTGFMGVLVWPTSQSSPKLQQQLQTQAGGLPGGQGCLPSDVNAPVPATVAPVSKGALVDGVLCGTPAVKAGLSGGDVITAVDGQAVTSPTSLTSLMERYRPGTRVSVSWADPSGGQHTSSVALIQAPPR